MSPTGLAPLPTNDNRPAYATAKVYNRAGEPVLVYGVPLPVARWIAESIDMLDYIDTADIDWLATMAYRARIAEHWGRTYSVYQLPR